MGSASAAGGAQQYIPKLYNEAAMADVTPIRGRSPPLGAGLQLLRILGGRGWYSSLVQIGVGMIGDDRVCLGSITGRQNPGYFFSEAPCFGVGPCPCLR